MKILNIMLSRDLGGIQQAFLDYSEALSLEGFEVINVTSIFAKINKQIYHSRSQSQLRVNSGGNPPCHPATGSRELVNNFWIPDQVWNDNSRHITLPNLGSWDIFSKLYLKLIIKFTKPDIIIAHGNRAIGFAYNNILPLIGVAHNYSLKGLKKCDYVISLTEHMRQYLTQQNFDPARIHLIPNMIHITKDFAQKAFKKPIVIGTVARFVPKKGVYVFLKALAKLKQQGYQFKAIIGGDGVEKDRLIDLSKNLAIDNEVEFTGWVTDRDKFFKDIDIFCLPSLDEPFGIIVLEAMMNSAPIVATKTQGPLEILRDKKDALLCSVNSSDDLAQKLAALIDNQSQTHKLTKSSYLRLKENYDINLVAKNLASFLKSISKT